MSSQERGHAQGKPKDIQAQVEKGLLRWRLRTQAAEILDKTSKRRIKKLAENYEKQVSPQILILAQQTFDNQKKEGKINRKDFPNLSAIDVTALIASEISDGLNQAASQIAHNGTPEGFAIFTDLAFGLDIVPKTLKAAELKIAGTLDSNIVDGEDVLFQKVDLTPEEQINTRLAMTTLAEKYANSLKKDPTGFSLVDALVTNLEQTQISHFLPFTKEFVVTGIRLGAKIHKLLHPQADAILNPK